MIEDKLSHEERIRLESVAQSIARSRMNNTLDEILKDAKAIEAFVLGEEAGKADWLWDDELEMHIPCCSVLGPPDPTNKRYRCGNGPLTGEAIILGDCGEPTHERRVIEDTFA